MNTLRTSDDAPSTQLAPLPQRFLRWRIITAVERQEQDDDSKGTMFWRTTAGQNSAAASVMWTVHPQIQHIQSCTADHISSREHAWLKSCKAQDCTPLCPEKQLSSTCHASSFAAPDTDHKHKFSLTHSIHFFYLSGGLTFTNKPHDSRPTHTMRCSTAEWRISTNPISHRLWAQVGWE